ncbi:alpha-glucosidase [Marinoscillum furvescens]|uniref:Oligo-1,6-glucosidase n=1 Tax=Marinoscillum furvescens DSM 4134 TaxID=1122208 RepID=A0A3D9KZA9_MARFU|nr:alpha-glucosidase [Marinoscillum furvescens]RED93613.1 oligo-1,6-glucosidase [Marinoscillum furvescens DSM 4134]
MNKKWWKEAVVYQVYPRSFKDSNGDGVGDLPGVIEKLDYIKSLGVDVIWLCPVYDSPNDDNGYDIRDYYDIMADFGTMADFDQLLEGIHQRGMKLLMDLVVNHCSDEHKWFQESRKSKDNPYRDYFIWKPGKNGGPPNNWQSFFSGNAWEYDEATDEYYLHLFTKKQPDLNWENPKVREEVHKLMKYWLDKGVDGFRMDVISVISKRNFEDSPYKDFNKTIDNVYANGPRVQEFLQEMNREVLSKYDVMTVGEGPGINLESGLQYVSSSAEALNMIFHFGHMFMDHGPGGRFDPKPIDFLEFKKVFRLWDEYLKEEGWGSVFLGNHDFQRIVSRFGDDGAYWKESAKLLSLLLFSMRGTVYVYQGDEIGMTNVAFDTIEEYDDVEIKNAYKEWKAEGKDLDQFLKNVHINGRDNARTPLQWNDAEQAGFTSGTPWLKVNPNYTAINVASQEGDENSILAFYRRMVAMRKEHPTLVYGDFAPIQEDHPSVFAFWRWDEEAAYLVLLNFSEETQEFGLDDRFDSSKLRIVEANDFDFGEPQSGKVKLKPWQAVLARVRHIEL